MRIALVGGYSKIPSRGAESIFLMQMAAAYADLGHEVKLFVNSDSSQTHDDCFLYYGVNPSFKIERIQIRNQKIVRFISLFLLFPFRISIFKPDLIHSKNLSVAWVCCRLLRYRTLTELHDFRIGNNSSLKRIFNSLLSSKHYLGTLVITNALANRLIQSFPQSSKLLVVPDGIDANLINDQRSPAVDFRYRLPKSIQPNYSFWVVYTGHLYKGRGIELIVECSKRLPNVLFMVVGGTDAAIQSFKKSTPELPNLIFTGFVNPSQVYVYQRAADILLMPYQKKVFVSGNSQTEEFASPMKLFEYMASGRPILSSELPVLKEILRHKENGLILGYDDVDEWVQAIETLYMDKDFAMRLSTQALQDVKKYSWLNRVKKIIDFTQETPSA